MALEPAPQDQLELRILCRKLGQTKHPLKLRVAMRHDLGQPRCAKLVGDHDPPLADVAAGVPRDRDAAPPFAAAGDRLGLIRRMGPKQAAKPAAARAGVSQGDDHFRLGERHVVKTVGDRGRFVEDEEHVIAVATRDPFLRRRIDEG